MHQRKKEGEQQSMISNITKAWKIIEGNDYPTFSYSILDHHIPGEILIDDLEKTALIGTNSGIFVVAGDENNRHFDHLLLEVFTNRKRENKRFTLFSPSKEWDDVIHGLLGNELNKFQRQSFHFNKKKYQAINTGEIPKGFEVSKINEQILSKSLEFNETYINEYWGSVENFLKHGFGYCLVHNSGIASVCISIFTSKKFAEVDIATDERFRGKGLALNAARLFIHHCIENHVIPRWDCDMSNDASIKLAIKLGFENPIEYSVFVRR